MLHADPGYHAVVGEDCAVGHKAILHGCQIGDGCLLGINAMVLNGAKIGEESMVAAGAVVSRAASSHPAAFWLGFQPRSALKTLARSRHGA